MNWATSFFLQAKSWEIFLLLFGVMAVSQIALVFSIQTTHGHVLGGVPLLFCGLMLLLMACMNGWLWAMGSFLNSIVPSNLRPGVGFFYFALIYPFPYVIVFMVSFPPSPAVLAVILPLHLLAMICMFYLLNFVAKNLVLAEVRQEVSFSDYAGSFLLLWLFPIGIWNIQPRINRLYSETRNGESRREATQTDPPSL